MKIVVDLKANYFFINRVGTLHNRTRWPLDERDYIELKIIRLPLQIYELLL